MFRVLHYTVIWNIQGAYSLAWISHYWRNVTIDCRILQSLLSKKIDAEFMGIAVFNDVKMSCCLQWLLRFRMLLPSLSSANFNWDKEKGCSKNVTLCPMEEPNIPVTETFVFYLFAFPFVFYGPEMEHLTMSSLGEQSNLHFYPSCWSREGQWYQSVPAGIVKYFMRFFRSAKDDFSRSVWYPFHRLINIVQ